MAKYQHLNEIIENLVVLEKKSILREQDPPPADDVKADDLSDLDAVLDDEPGDEGGLDLDAGDEGDFGDAEGGLDLDAGAEEGEEGDFDDAGGDFGGGGGGFGGGGGGFGDFGDDEGEGLEDDEEAAEEETEAAIEELIPEDPVQAIVDEAVAMLEITEDDQEILNSVKASIQKYFENFDEATPVIYELYNTKSPVLLLVARKLLQFLKGT
jgi:hypothetical protein